MEKEETKHRRRIRGLIILLVFTAMILSIATYAWFIGMRTVNIKAFDVKIASTEDLLLSLNGVTWDTTVHINEGNYDEDDSETDYGNVYQGHTNWWDELVPMSSVGETDHAASRMILYEKASLTATKGGYRLMASRVPNTGATEHRGYVAFDLFIRNFSGTQYNVDLNMDDEEAIYLAIDSLVEVALSGVENTGIENSVRVGFAQIGRVIGTTAGVGTLTTPTGNAEAITSIACTTDGNPVTATIAVPAGTVEQTGICMHEDGDSNSRTAAIWEPNDTKHVKAALDYYEESCRLRTGDDTSIAGSYSATRCSSPTDLGGGVYEYVPTYAVREAITNGKLVDVYDGDEYNGYLDNTSVPGSTAPTTPLYAFPTFTDTMKEVTGVDRQAIFTLAPNSVTKVRVYIWIEGQDIDNYDFAAIGKAITINFGFTKQRFEPTDIGYDGPELRPVWTFGGVEMKHDVDPANMYLTPAQTIPVDGVPTFYDRGDGTGTSFKVVDTYDGDITSDMVKVTVSNNVDATKPGTYTIIYRATNSNGLSTVVKQNVIVEDTP